MDLSSYDAIFRIWTETQAALKRAKIITDSNVFADDEFLDDDEQYYESKRSQRNFKNTGEFTIHNDELSVNNDETRISCRISIGDGENRHENRLNMHNLLKLGTKELGKQLKQYLSQWIEIRDVEVEVEIEKTERIFLLIIYRI